MAEASAGSAAKEGGAPTLFLWRGRVYAVRSILGHWRERRAWWLEGATARLLGLDPVLCADEPEEGSVVSDVLEREIWRVEAGAGRSGVTGVFDLGRDGVEPDARWRLLQVAD